MEWLFIYFPDTLEIWEECSAMPESVLSHAKLEKLKDVFIPYKVDCIAFVFLGFSHFVSSRY